LAPGESKGFGFGGGQVGILIPMTTRGKTEWYVDGRGVTVFLRQVIRDTSEKGYVTQI